MAENSLNEQQSQSTVNLRTWPRASLSQRSLNDLQQRIQLEKAIKLARQRLHERKPDVKSEGNQDENQAGNQAGNSETDILNQQNTCQRITSKLLKALERIRDTKNEQLLQRSGIRRRKRRESLASDEPHFGSMILVGTLQKEQAKALQRGMAAFKDEQSLIDRRKSIPILTDDLPSKSLEEGLERTLEPTTIEEEKKEIDTILCLINYLPLFTSLVGALLLLLFGAFLFRLIDEKIAEQPFHRAVLFTFQAVATIGWGDIRPGNKLSQAFCTLYTIFGVPIFFSALANVGRLISDFYTLDWLFLTCVVRPMSKDKIGPSAQKQIALRKSLYLLCVHQLIGMFIYGALLKQYTPIVVLYFCLTSMATIGIGDYHPDAGSLWQALVAIIFMSIGMVLLASLLIALAYHFQTIFFVHLQGWLQRKFDERK
uniref:Potassium channel domain-containing protein n=1 Tax=Meloidogyne enterolobii TaxID=390850 RepID=A0A6V7WTF3_MELEN|nr:unnamed protein product [Meloidogyne enterolobii]